MHRCTSLWNIPFLEIIPILVIIPQYPDKINRLFVANKTAFVNKHDYKAVFRLFPGKFSTKVESCLSKLHISLS